MITSIIILSSIILVRTFLFYYNYLFSLVNLLPMEMIALGTSNLNCNIDNCQKPSYQVILDWIFLGWVDRPNIIHQVGNTEIYSSWIPIISLFVSLFFFILFRLIYLRNNFTRINLVEAIIRFLIIHFSWIIIWTINNLLFLPKGNFWILFFNLILFCIFSSGLMALIFKMIYGKYYIYYRYNYYWLIQFYNRKYKYYLLIDLFKRLLSSFFIFFYHYHLPWGMVYLLGLQIIFLIIVRLTDVFSNRYNKRILLINLLVSLIPSILSLLKNIFLDYSSVIDLINFIFMILYLMINVIIFIIKSDKHIIIPPNIEMSTVG